MHHGMYQSLDRRPDGGRIIHYSSGSQPFSVKGPLLPRKILGVSHIIGQCPLFPHLAELATRGGVQIKKIFLSRLTPLLDTASPCIYKQRSTYFSPCVKLKKNE